MKALIYPILLLSFTNLLAQTSDPDLLNTRIDSLIIHYQNLDSESRLKDGMQILEDARDLCLTNKTSQVCFNVERHIAVLLFDQGDYENAKNVFVGLLNDIGSEHKNYSEVYANALNKLAETYEYLAKYDYAENSYKDCINYHIKHQEEETVAYATALNGLGICYKRNANYEEAEPYYLKSLSIIEKLNGKKNHDYAVMLNNLAVYYKAARIYDKAEQAYLECKSIQEEIGDPNDPVYAITLFNLGILYSTMGEKHKAEPLFIKGKDIREKVLGRNHPDYARSLNIMAVLYKQLGQLEKAEQYYLESKEIRKATIGVDHPLYAGLLNNMGKLYATMGDMEKAEAYLLESLELDKKNFGEDHPYYAFGLINLGNILDSQERFEESIAAYLHSKEIIEKKYGNTHINYARVLTDLACAYQDAGMPQKAEPIFLESLEIQKDLNSQNQLQYGITIYHMAHFYLSTQQYEKATAFVKETFEIEKRKIANAQKFLSESELRRFIKKYLSNYFDTFSFLEASNAPDYLKAICYDYVLHYKGYLLNTVQRIRRYELRDTSLQNEFSLLKSYNRRLERLISKNQKKKDSLEIQSLKSQLNNVEKVIATKIADYSKAKENSSWHQVHNALDSSEAAIEFIHYKSRNALYKDEFVYGALILKPNESSPRYIHLCTEKELKDLIYTDYGRRSDYVNKLYSYSDRGTTVIGKSQKTLYQLIWIKIDKELQGINKVYFAPTGLLHRINLSAIAIDKSQIIADKYELVQLSCTDQILEKSTVSSNTSQALLLGGIEYDFRKITTKEIDSTNQQRSGSWSFLDYSEDEINNIKDILSSSNIKSSTLVKEYATEEKFKSLSSSNASPEIIHLATHGFFYPNPKSDELFYSESIFAKSEDPMIRSGLVLAGANSSWTGSNNLENKEDGILTAFEVSSLNLNNTELVVLSACETGLGDLWANEGVYGLQRAFKIAGVKQMIMSLWQVPDRQTMAFMTCFYQNWISDEMPIREAFQKTQLEMRDRFYDPYAWAGFVLIE